MSRIFTDQMGRSVTVPDKPVRIVSLVPSQTELLHDLGLEEEVVGITKFCVHPESWFKSKTRIGGTKKIRIDIVRSLFPDLIIGNKEENSRDDIEQLIKEYPVWMSDISTLEDALVMISGIGCLAGREEAAQKMTGTIRQRFDDLEKTAMGKPLRVLYLIWSRPWMGAGGMTFIGDMLRRCGFRNVLEDVDRYPGLTGDDLLALQPDVVLLSSEPYPFKAEHAVEVKNSLPSAAVFFADGEMFSWYGSRLLQSPSYMTEISAQIRAGF